MSIALYVLIAIHKRSETAKHAALEGYYKEQTTSVSSPPPSLALLGVARADDQVSEFDLVFPFCHDGFVEARDSCRR